MMSIVILDPQRVAELPLRLSEIELKLQQAARGDAELPRWALVANYAACLVTGDKPERLRNLSVFEGRSDVDEIRDEAEALLKTWSATDEGRRLLAELRPTKSPQRDQ